MSMKSFLALVLAFLGLLSLGSAMTWAQAPASLLVTTDTECDWKLDGVAQGRLTTDDAKVVKTVAGEHLVQATSADGQLKWQGSVTADSSAQKLVKIPLSGMRPTWTDPATGLTWARQDNGSYLNWNQAANYCQSLNLGGYSTWRLPTIDELAGIYDPPPNGYVRIKGGITLSDGWPWTNNADATLYFNFVHGMRDRMSLDKTRWGRALCVSRSGE